MQSPVHKEVIKTLSGFETMLVKHLKRIETPGKRNNRVPIIMTPLHVRCLLLLLDCRSKVGVRKDNVYFFALSSTTAFTRGYDALKSQVNQCTGLTNPEAIKATQLRKQVATLTQMLNLTTNETEFFGVFLGHSKEIHKEYYRQQEGTLQLAKMLKIILAIDEGVGEYVGKQLNEIDLKSLPFDVNENAADEGYESGEPDTLTDDQAFADDGSSDLEKVTDETIQGDADEDDEGTAEDEEEKEDMDMTTNVSLNSTGTENFLRPRSPRKNKKPGKSKRTSNDGNGRTKRPRKAETKPRRPFSTKEQHIVQKALKDCFLEKRAGRKVECQRVLDTNPEYFDQRTWKDIKGCVATLQKKGVVVVQK